jgi:hypothetical protein
MNGHELDDRTNNGLASLAVLAPDDAHSARVRVRCRAQLARRARPSTPAPDVRRRAIAPAIVLAVCGVYVYSLVSTALEIARLL